MQAQISGWSIAIQWLFGSIVVLLYARDRFETPVPARATTTFARYWAARGGYILSMFMLYLLLAGAFTDVAPILKMLAGLPGQEIDDELTALPGPLFSALLLTSLLPHIPHLKQIDETVKRWFQRLGNIPLEVRALSGQIKHTRVSVPSRQMEKLRVLLEEMGVDPALIQARENTFAHRWARIAALYAAIRQWEHSGIYTRYADENAQAFKSIAKLLQDAQGLGGAVLCDPAQEAELSRALRPRLSQDLNVLHQALCDYIAGGVLRSGRSPRQRSELLADLGFESGSKPVQQLSAHDVVLVGGIIFLLLLFTSLFLNQNLGSTDLSSNLNVRVLFMVPIIYCVAIVAAIYPKSFWSFADIRIAGRRPVLGYVASGLLAATAAFVIQLLFRYAQGGIGEMVAPGAFTQAIRTNADRWPWFLMNFLMTIAIAWIADDHALVKGKEPQWLRAAETIGMAFVCGLLQWVTLELLIDFSSNPGRWDGRVDKMVLTATLIGGVIGFYVPHFYRARAGADSKAEAGRIVHPDRRMQWTGTEADRAG